MKYQYCKVQKEVVPQDQVIRVDNTINVDSAYLDSLMKHWEDRRGKSSRQRFAYCSFRGEVVPIEKVIRENKSAYVHQDTMDPIESMATPDREVFDSKSAYRQHLKEKGFEITGGDHNTGKTVENHEYKPEGMVDTVAEVVRQNEWGMLPQTEREKERCLREQRALESEARRQGVSLPRALKGEW